MYMEVKQEFLEDDLLEVRQVILKSAHGNRKESNLNKKWFKPTIYFFAFIILWCSIGIYTVEGYCTEEIKFFGVMAIITFCSPYLLETFQRKTEDFLLKKLSQKYGNPFTVKFMEDSLEYKQQKLLYSAITYIIEYKHFLFVILKSKFVIIKIEKAEREYFIEKLKGLSNITFLQKDEPFNIKQFFAK